MTTDTRPKIASVQHPAGYTITGIAKGAGMIAPNMATMLSIIATDADIPAETLTRALRQAVDVSFNRIVVDGDMSTNDTVLLLANGAVGCYTQRSRVRRGADRTSVRHLRRRLCATAKARPNLSRSTSRARPIRSPRATGRACDCHIRASQNRVLRR